MNMANLDKFYMKHKKNVDPVKVVESLNEWGYRLFFILLLWSDIRQNAPQTFYNFKIFRWGLVMSLAFNSFCVSYAPAKHLIDVYLVGPQCVCMY